MLSKYSNNSIPVEDIPVLLTVFNRPDKTRAVIENIRQHKPKKLFISADGPRLNVQGDMEKCRLAREESMNIDWDCDLKTRFLDDNMGCDPAVSSAIDWFFKNVEYGIILEDDCIVSDQFFTFCGELLARYFDDERIMQISSLSPYEIREHEYQYHFSRMFRCSGAWSTWGRAWRHYTSDMHHYSDSEALEILKAYQLDYSVFLWQHKELINLKGNVLNKPYFDHYWSHWDAQWNLACFAQNGLCIVPEKNLMSNIGFDEESTHTKEAPVLFENLEIQQLTFPLHHPPFVYADSRPERSLEKKIYRGFPLKNRGMYLLRRALGSIHYFRARLPFG